MYNHYLVSVNYLYRADMTWYECMIIYRSSDQILFSKFSHWRTTQAILFQIVFSFTDTILILCRKGLWVSSELSGKIWSTKMSVSRPCEYSEPFCLRHRSSRRTHSSCCSSYNTVWPALHYTPSSKRQCRLRQQRQPEGGSVPALCWGFTRLSGFIPTEGSLSSGCTGCLYLIIHAR